MVLSAEHKKLMHALMKEHASNKIVRRQVSRGVSAVKKGVAYYKKHPGAVQRDIGRASNFIRTVAGRGDYHIFTSSGIKHQRGQSHDGGRMYKSRSSAPHVKLEKGEMIIEHSEYIGELISPGAAVTTQGFGSQVYQINPGNQGTFPWLSGTAINFQMYEFEKLIFEYKPLVSDSATTTTSGALTSMGSVMAAVQYDTVDGPYVNKNTMENAYGSVSCKPSCGMMMHVECEPKFNPLGVLYVNGSTGNTTLPLIGSNANPANTDVRFQDLGLFQIASYGIPTQSGVPIDLGEIWVHYKIKLLKPQLNAGIFNLQSAHYICNTGVSSTSLLGTFPTASSTNYMTLTFPSSNSFSFPLAITEGAFLCILHLVNITNITSPYTPPTVTVATGGTLVTIFNGSGGTDSNSTAAQAPISAGAITLPTAILAFIVSVNAPGATLCTVTLPTTYTLTGAPQSELFVTPWNLSITN